MKLSLIIPCYNEARSLPSLVARCEEVASSARAEVILVNNGSTDETEKVMATLLEGSKHCRSITVPVNQGYGFGILSGLHAAQGDILAWTHADMQTDPADVLAAFEKFQEAADPESLFVKGRRINRPFSDRVFTLGMSVFETFLIGSFLSDINAQPTMFPRSFFSSWKEPPHDFSIDLYAYALAKRDRMTVSRHPVRFGVREHGISSWNVDINSKLKFIRRTLSYSFQLRRKIKSSK